MDWEPRRKASSPLKKIRVLVVDDSVVIRKILTETLSSDPSIEVVGVAANGRIALSKIPQVNPDLITLDIEMPEMDGLTTLKSLRKDYPRLPVVMFSTLTERGAEATLDALSFGASDYVTKPANVGKVSEAIERLRNELVPKVKALVPGLMPATVRPVRREPAKRPFAPALSGRKPARIDIVAIGVSTGGPNALSEVLPALPETLAAPVVIVQHMPPVFTKNLADRLDAKSAIRVREAEAGDVLSAGGAWIAPGGYHMVVERCGAENRIALNEDPPQNSCRPAVDVLFRSVTECYGPHVLAVMMTGMGHDGLIGCEHVCAEGGRVICQDEATSVVWGMPGIVVERELADAVLPLQDLAAAIVERVSKSRRAARALSAEGSPS